MYQAAGDVAVVKLIPAAFPRGGLVAEFRSEFLESDCVLEAGSYRCYSQATAATNLVSVLVEGIFLPCI